MRPDLAIVILGYNVRELLVGCLDSVFRQQTIKDKWQVIVVDNASSDGTVAAVKKRFPQVEVVASRKNLGFAAGNNLAGPRIKADYALFLNPDTVIVGDVIGKSLEYIKAHPEVGALTCRVELPDGRLDYSCHRGLPTPWNTFCYLSGLSRLFPKQKLFAGYSATYLDPAQSHEIDCGSGTFFLVRKEAAEEVGWWDEDYFWNGEDIEFCYRLKQAGWKIYYLASGKIIHHKGSSSGLWGTAKMEVARETRLRSARSAIRAMRIFVNKHAAELGPAPVMWLVRAGIYLLEKTRLLIVGWGLKYA